MLVITAITLGAIVRPARAQSIPQRLVDTRLRIETRQGLLLTGRVIRVNRDSVLLRDDRARDVVAIAHEDVRQFEESSGVRRASGAKRGALVGGALGVALIAVAAQRDASFQGDAIGATNLLFSVPVAVALTLLGTAFGAASAGEDWEAPRAFRIGASEARGVVLSYRIVF